MGKGLNESRRIVKIEIVVEADDPKEDRNIKAALLSLGTLLCSIGHENVMDCEVLYHPDGPEKGKEAAPQRTQDPNMN